MVSACPLTRQDNVRWMPLFNSRENRPAKVMCETKLRLIRHKELKNRCALSTQRSSQRAYTSPVLRSPASA